MDIFDTGVVHSSGAAGFGVECAFKDCTEDSRGDVAPVKIITGLGEENVFDFVIQTRNFDCITFIFRAEEASVDIWEFREFWVEIRIAFFNGCIKDFKEVEECATEIARIKADEIIVKLTFFAEDAGVFGVETEDEADAKFVETFESGFPLRVFVKFQNFIIELTNDVSRLN